MVYKKAAAIFDLAKLLKKKNKTFRFSVNVFTFDKKIIRYMKENQDKTQLILKKIREMRKIKGLSHENMAIELGMSPSAYNKLERSETLLSLERFFKIVDILHVPLTELLDIKTGDILNQNLKDNAIGKVETLYQENKEVNEKLLEAKDDQIQLLKELVEFMKESK